LGEIIGCGNGVWIPLADDNADFAGVQTFNGGQIEDAGVAEVKLLEHVLGPTIVDILALINLRVEVER
jgi:hypothetical protein